MFIALRFVFSMMALMGMALFPNEWRIITRLGISILLLLYEIEDVIEMVGMIKKSGEIK